MDNQRRRIPYELLNAREWMTDDQGGLVHVESDVEYFSDEDEWAEKSTVSTTSKDDRSGRPSLPSTIVQTKENVRPQQGIRNPTQLESPPKEHGWATVSRKGTKLPTQAYLKQQYQTLSKPQTSSRPLTTPTRVSTSQSSSKIQHVVKSRQVRRPIYRFERDNTGKAAYRRRQAPVEVFLLYRDAIEVEPDEKKLYRMLEEFGKRFRTFCCPPQHPESREIPIWGSEQDVARTVRALRKWVSGVENGPSSTTKTSRKSEHFAKMPSANTLKHQRELKRMKKEAALRVFLQKPDPAQHYPIDGWQLWIEHDSDPTEIFGHNMEAFDPIKRSCRCHIEFHDQARAFHVLGAKEARVNDALSRIGVAVQGVVVQTQSRKIVEFAADVRSLNPPHSHITLDVQTLSNGKTIIFPKGTGIESKTSTPCSDLEAGTYSDLEKRMVDGFEEALPSLPYFSGRLTMRVIFGTLRLTQFPKLEGPVDVQAFLGHIRRPGIRGEMIRNIPDLGQFYNEKEKVELARSMLEALTLSNTEFQLIAPRIGGRFLITRSDRPAVQYQIEWSQLDNAGNYFPAPGVWTRADRKDMEIPMQICMLRFDDCVSWEFSMVKDHHLSPSQIDPKMSSFASGVSLVPTGIANLKHTGRKQITYSTELGELKPSEFEQKIAFCYRLKEAPEWVVEVTRYDAYAPNRDLPESTSWAVSMMNTHWDAITSGNQKVSIGECANWSPTLDTFFPSDGDGAPTRLRGVTGFIQVVQKVAQFVDQLKTKGSGAQ